MKWRIVGVGVLALVQAACYGGATVDAWDMGGEPAPPAEPALQITPPGTEGVPCAVVQVLSAKCQSCHGAALSGGAPFSLVTYDDLTRASPSYPDQTVLQRSLVRMAATTAAMPPGGSPVPEEISALQGWLDRGAGKEATCATASTEPVCTSGVYWTRGDSGDPKMHPGVACVSCHDRKDGPQLVMGGTVYPTLHEPDDCLGVAALGRVEVTDSTGRMVSAAVNLNGNFSIKEAAALIPPIKARVVYAGRVREMVGAQPSVDCNSCHSAQGSDGAPGRIQLP